MDFESRRYLQRTQNRIRSRSKRKNGCWVWTRYLDPAGYGRLGFKGKHEYVHRVSYTVFKGPIPEGTEIDHVCRNRACCNPEHLEAVSHRVNLERSPLHIMFNPELRPPISKKKQTHCKHGHELNAENRNANGRCKQCARDWVARRYQVRKETDPAWVERERQRSRARTERARQESLAS